MINALRKTGLSVLVAGAMLAMAGVAGADDSFEAEVRVTSYGIPHIKADNYAGLGYGYGNYYASHNLCILAREIVAANGQRARWFGDSQSNITSDYFYTFVNSDAFIASALNQLSADGRELLIGYAAGYNRYLADTGVANLAEDCRDESWVRPITDTDLMRVFYKLILRASGGPLSPLIVDAEPPMVASVNADNASREALVSETVNRVLEAGKHLDKDAFATLTNAGDKLGSNMYALGGNTTPNGRGMVLGNPHFDWNGPLRWYEVHLTIPGEIDVMGASLQGVPLVNIGFTKDFAWSHTVSPAQRFTLFELALVPGQPTRYLYDGQELEMTSTTVTIEVMEGDGSITTRDHTFYETIHGKVLDFTPFFGFPFWNTGLGVFALGDANAENLRAIDQFLDMDRAQSLDEFIDVLKDNVGLPWVHTVAADRNGDAFYGDVSVVPNVSQAKLDACPPIAFGGAIQDLAGLVVLDGTRSECRWDIDADAPQDGIIGAAALPSIETRDYVTNSNDNHWLANAENPLEGFSPMFGTEQTARSLRTRLGLVLVAQRLAGSDGLGTPGFTLDTLQELLFGSRNYAAELLLDDLVTLCGEEGPTVEIDGGTLVDVTAACAVLANWDKRQNADSTGPHIWVEMIEAAFADLDDPLLTDLYAVPFDVNDPVNTPRDLKADDAASRERIMEYLATGVQRLLDNSIAIDAVWGDIHFEEKNGVRYPIHGGRDGSGMFSIITTSLQDGVGYTPVRHGNSYMQTVTWDDDGNVVPEALLSYSQSSDPASPNYADQTALYAAKQWVALPFTDAQILADPNYTSFTVSEPRFVDDDGDGITNKLDNCRLVANDDQRDTDNDGFGNRCDADFNQDNVINFIDLGYIKSVFFSTDELADLDGDGDVNFVDLAIVKEQFFGAPGPGLPQE